jgi:uncharacterized membrane protein YhaH (DUF805 family)
MDWGNYLFSFQGRLNRAKWWLWIGLVLTPALVYESFVTRTLGLSWRQFGQIFSGSGLANPVGQKALLLMLPFWLITAVPSLAIGVKRLHDRNRKGWWIILFVYAPWVLGIFQPTILQSLGRDAHLPKTLANILIGLSVTSLDVWGFVELYCLRGTVGQNGFGPDPLGTPVEHVLE